jgi:hypothetical protein
MTRKTIGWAVGVAVVVLVLGLMTFRPAGAQQPGGAAAGGGPKYTIVQTEVTNLLVVDNSTNTVYFYTVDEGKEPGSDLHLRGSLDLNKVGEKVLKPKKAEK